MGITKSDVFAEHFAFEVCHAFILRLNVPHRLAMLKIYSATIVELNCDHRVEIKIKVMLGPPTWGTSEAAWIITVTQWKRVNVLRV